MRHRRNKTMVGKHKDMTVEDISNNLHVFPSDSKESDYSCY